MGWGMSLLVIVLSFPSVRVRVCPQGHTRSPVLTGMVMSSGFSFRQECNVFSGQIFFIALRCMHCSHCFHLLT